MHSCLIDKAKLDLRKGKMSKKTSKNAKISFLARIKKSDKHALNSVLSFLSQFLN